MFFPNSRYAKTGAYTVAGPDGSLVEVARIPRPRRARLQGLHRREEAQRLDHIAAHYLKDATAFWQLCDANDAVVPDALATGGLVGIPPAGE